MRVFIVAPTPMMQAGLHALLSDPAIHIVGSSSLNDTFLTSPPQADVFVVADELQLEEVVRTVAGSQTTSLVALVDNEERAISVLRVQPLQGWGLVPVDTSARQLQAVVIAVSQGLVALPTRAANHLGEHVPLVAETVTLVPGDDALTPREREVLELVGQGLPNKLIARRLQISEHTVKFHLSSISTKLGASSRTDAVRRGLRQGLIPL